MGGYPTVIPQGPALPYVLAPRHATLEDQRGADHALAGSRLEYLTPFWPVILADYGVTIVLHPGSDWAALAAASAVSSAPPDSPISGAASSS